MLARSVGVALWEAEALPGGAFEVDLTGECFGLCLACIAGLIEVHAASPPCWCIAQVYYCAGECHAWHNTAIANPPSQA